MKHIKLLPLLTLPLLLLTGCDNNDIHGYTFKTYGYVSIDSHLCYTTDGANYLKTYVRRYNDNTHTLVDYVYIPRSLLPQPTSIYYTFDIWYRYDNRIGYFIATKATLLSYGDK